MSLFTARPGTEAQQLNVDQQLARDIYKQLVEINTSNMSSGTTVAAEAMAKRLRDAGFPEADIFLGGARADKHNLVVRYHGKGGANGPKPLPLLAHIDVVEARKSDWSPDLDPFSFLERDGYFHGRGTADDKPMAAIFVANLIRFKREGWVPDRDIIVALTADEEGTPCGCNGVRWLLQNHKPLVDAAYVINEGGGGSLRGDKPFLNSIQATQKNSINFTATARNRCGHSSVPRPDNAIYQLSQGLARFSKHNFPVPFNTVTRAFFEKTAEVESPEMKKAMKDLLTSEKNERAAAFVSKDPRYNSMLRSTCVATGLRGGHAANALPQTAEARINCRILPDADPEEIRAGIVAALGDTAIEVSKMVARPFVEPSPLLPEIMGPVETVTRELFGNIPVIPTMSTGATDSQPFRQAGIPAFGVSGLMSDPEEIRAHGRDERMRVKSFFDGHEFLLRLTRLLASGKAVS